MMGIYSRFIKYIYNVGEVLLLEHDMICGHRQRTNEKHKLIFIFRLDETRLSNIQISCMKLEQILCHVINNKGKEGHILPLVTLL